MEYLILTVCLFIGLLIYFKIADHYNIVDKPNERSSHQDVTLRGGGVIYWIAAAIFVAFNHQTADWLVFFGLTLITLISFLDDLNEVSPKIRLLCQLIAMTMVFYVAGIFSQFSFWVVVFGYILFIGILNAWNFMDGINGMTGLYSIAVLAGLQYINLVKIPFINPALIWYPMIASAVFLFFNFRKKARCFAGDVGSVSIAFWVVFLILMLMIKAESFVWIGFMMVYGVDTIYTILHRFFLKHNIFQAHRLHFYQIMVNERNLPHRLVSVYYFVAQLICSFAIVLLFPSMGWWIFLLLIVLLSDIYMLKFLFLKKSNYATN